MVGHGLFQGLGQPDQQGVAGGVAEAVVVALEAVEVEQHQQQRPGRVRAPAGSTILSITWLETGWTDQLGREP